MKNNPEIAIIFDCADTLIHLDPTPEKITTDFLKEKGVNIGIRDVKTAYRIVNFNMKQSSIKFNNARKKKEFLIEYNKQLIKALGLYSNSEEWAKQLYDRFSKHKMWAVFHDTIPALNALRECDFMLGVVANWDATLRSVLEKLSISAFFDILISSGEVGLEKPSPEIFDLALKALDVSADRTFYIGNEYEIDVIGARNSGIRPVLIDRDNIFRFADCLRFKNLSEMSEYFKNTFEGKNEF
jgi:REG-2-like HAD superfamily hydrolase